MVVATHRHQDHIKGFGLAKAGKIIRKLEPDVVVQPWTEDPDIPIDASAPVSRRRRNLANMNLAAERLFDEGQFGKIEHLRQSAPQQFAESMFAELKFIGEDNIKNKKAVEALIEMGKAGKAKFVHAKEKLRVKNIIPGVDIDVLGPPTVEQYGEITSMRRWDDDEFWPLQAAAAQGVENALDPFPDEKNEDESFDTRWLAGRLRGIRLDALLRIVRALDREMNNTSLILLFKAQDKSFLFPGDAQIENWEFALRNEEVLNKLAKVDVYKVGHHGSTNATPQTLWKQFSRKGGKRKRNRLTSILSTLEGKHHHVPRESLLGELSRKSNLVWTETFERKQLFEETIIEL
jgi:hypothetical protein